MFRSPCPTTIKSRLRHFFSAIGLLNRDRGYQTAVGGANIQIVHFFDHGYLEEEKSMIHSFTVTFGAKYLTDVVTSVPPYETFSLIKKKSLPV